MVNSTANRIKAFSLTLLVIAFDRLTKAEALKNLKLFDSVKVIGNFVRFTLAKNPGGAFGTRIGNNYVYIIAAIVAGALLIIWLFEKKSSIAHAAAIAVILGGAIGNLWDRIKYGVVIDFIDVGVKNFRWPTFNVADSAITVGIIILLVAELFYTPKAKKAE